MQSFNKCLLLAALFSTSALADGFSASIGADYNTGKYGSDVRTDVAYIPFTASYVTGRMTYKLIVPWVSVTGNVTVTPSGFGGSGEGSSGGIGLTCVADKHGQKGVTDDCSNIASGSSSTTTTTQRTTESGLGDIVASATMNLIDDQDWVADVTGKVKFPTASESRGLGSGEADYAIQANVDKYFGAPYVSAGLGYRWLGEPNGVSLDNVVYGSIGGGYKFSEKTSAGVSYDWATASSDGASEPQEVSIYASYEISDNYKLNGSLYAGLSDASPDVGGGLTLNYYF